MEANLLAAEPSARGLRERKHGGEQEQPEDQARDYTGEEAGVERSPVRRFHRRLASMSLVVLAVVQILWIALLAYAAYSAVIFLSP